MSAPTATVEPTAADLLNQLDQAHAAATPGPWAVHPSDASEVVGMWKSDDEADDGWEGIDVCAARTPTPGTMGGDSAAEDANAALIVAAVNALPKVTAALRATLKLHSPVEWHEADENGQITEASLDKPLPPFCHECTDDEYVAAIEFGDTIDQGAPVVNWPCPTVTAIQTALQA